MKTAKKRPVHPGEVIREELEERGLSARALADAIHVPSNRVSAIVNGTRAVTADTALRLAKFFGTTPELWMGLQTQHDLIVAEAAARTSLRHIAKAS